MRVFGTFSVRRDGRELIATLSLRLLIHLIYLLHQSLHLKSAISASFLRRCSLAEFTFIVCNIIHFHDSFFVFFYISRYK